MVDCLDCLGATSMLLNLIISLRQQHLNKLAEVHYSVAIEVSFLYHLNNLSFAQSFSKDTHHQLQLSRTDEIVIDLLRHQVEKLFQVERAARIHISLCHQDVHASL